MDKQKVAIGINIKTDSKNGNDVWFHLKSLLYLIMLGLLGMAVFWTWAVNRH